MSRRRRVLRAVAIIVGALLLAAVVFAPSWRSYYLRRGSVRIIEDQAYVPGSSDRRQQVDLYVPTAGSRPWPTVIFIHGGYWNPMDRRLYQPFTGLHGGVGVALANRGYATAVVGYRQYPEAATIGAALEDIGRATRFAIDRLAREGADRSRVYIVGHSAGGMMASLLALQPEHLRRAGVATESVRGYASLGGAYDLERLATAVGGELATKIRASAGGGDGLVRFSPERSVRAGHPPMLVLVGTNDSPPLLNEQQHMLAALRAAGGDATGVDVPGEAHMDLVMHLSNKDDGTLAALLRFMEAHR